MTIRTAIRDALGTGTPPLTVVSEIASALMPAQPAGDTMRTLVGAIGLQNVAGRLGLFTSEVQAWNVGGVEWRVPPEHVAGLRKIAAGLAVTMLAAASEGGE